MLDSDGNFGKMTVQSNPIASPPPPQHTHTKLDIPCNTRDIYDDALIRFIKQL